MSRQSITRRVDHLAIDLSSARRLLVCGDVHGHLDLLIERLKTLAYDSDLGDRLICLGDWLDRGDDVLEIRDWLDANPTVGWLRGNHEHLLHCSLHEGEWFDPHQAQIIHRRHGGLWIEKHEIEGPDDETYVSGEIVAFSDKLNAAPVAIRVRTPGGRDVGLVHADVPAKTWGEMARILESDRPIRERMAIDCMWSRTRAEMVLDGGATDGRMSVPDVDHVFFGHTIVGPVPVRHGNLSYIDTGAFGSGILTVIDVDEWITDAT